MATDFGLTLPNIPASQKILSIDTSGNILSNYDADNSTIEIVSNTIRIPTAQQQIFAPPGMISAYAGGGAPTGWLLCDGSAVSRTTYSALFAAISVFWGQGNGATTFNVPDLRGYFLRGVDGSAGIDPDKLTRTAIATGGNTGNNVGSYQTDQIVSHNHSYGYRQREQTNASAGSNGYTFDSGTVTTGSTGGNETRPKNAYVNYIIKT